MLWQLVACYDNNNIGLRRDADRDGFSVGSFKNKVFYSDHLRCLINMAYVNFGL